MGCSLLHYSAGFLLYSGTWFSSLNGLWCTIPFLLTCFALTFLLPPYSVVSLVGSFQFLYFKHKLIWYTCVTSLICFPSLQYKSTISATLLLQSCSHFYGMWQFCLRLWKPPPFSYFPSCHFLELNVALLFTFLNFLKMCIPKNLLVGFSCYLCLISISISSDFPIG